MRYYIIAGEASGDLHGGNLIKALKQTDPNAEIRCWGGDLMQGAGGDLVVHYREMAYMGFLEVFLNLRTIWKRLKFCQQDLMAFGPDVLILIDYPGFNLRMARYAKERGLKVCYYISPKVWAWKQSRVHSIKRYVDRMFVILPFETAFYQKFDYAVEYVGNPLVEAIEKHRINANFKSDHQLDDHPLIAVLPGSRKQEMEQMLDLMVSIADSFPDFTFVVAGVNNLPKSCYQLVVEHPKIKLVFDQTYDLLAHSHAALVTSGTATLETALFKVPQVICYKTSWVTYQIAKRLIKVSFISLVNLIAEKEVAKELIQGAYNREQLTAELKLIVQNDSHRSSQVEAYKGIITKLTSKNASQNTARLTVEFLNPGKSG